MYTSEFDETGEPVTARDRFASAVFPCFVYTCRALTVAVSHRDDVPPRRAAAAAAGACRLAYHQKERREEGNSEGSEGGNYADQGVSLSSPSSPASPAASTDTASSASAACADPEIPAESGGLRASFGRASLRDSAAALRRSHTVARGSLAVFVGGLTGAAAELDDEEASELARAEEEDAAAAEAAEVEGAYAVRGENPMALATESNDL